jgi:soluble lytic murein transglycosylase-like protein
MAGPLLGFALALANAPANAQAGATPAAPESGGGAHASELHEPSAKPATADDICRALEQSAAENGLPVESFARVIWQESRFDARAVSPKGAAGIAQFMPRTAGWRGLADPFDSIESLRHSAAYLRELLSQFGKLGLAAAYIAFASPKKRRLPSACPQVELRPKITWSGNRRPGAEELDKMHHAAHENCFIANSVKTKVTVAER